MRVNKFQYNPEAYQYQRQVPTMGRDETEAGMLFVRLWDPTELDKAGEALRLELKQNLSTWDTIKYAGMFGGGARDFVRHYIDIAHRIRQYFNPNTRGMFRAEFLRLGEYDNDDLDVYFPYWQRVIDQGKVGDPVLKPYTYTPKESDSPLNKMINKAVVAVVIGGVSYLLLKTIIFKGPQLAKTYGKALGGRRAGKRRRMA